MIVHVVACIRTSFPFSPFYYRIYHIFFAHPSGDENLRCFHFLALMNSAMNTRVQIFAWTYVFILLIHRSRISKWYGASVSHFEVIPDQSSCIILHAHQQWKRIAISPHASQHMLPAVLSKVSWDIDRDCLYLSFNFGNIVTLSLLMHEHETFFRAFRSFKFYFQKYFLVSGCKIWRSLFLLFIFIVFTSFPSFVGE